jgi:hypothetical protein
MSDANPEHMDPGTRPAARQEDALAPHRRRQPAKQVGLDPGPGVADVELPVSRVVGVGLLGGEQGPVDAVPGHQLGGLRGERLSFGGRDAPGFGFGEQFADTLKQRIVASHG